MRRELQDEQTTPRSWLVRRRLLVAVIGLLPAALGGYSAVTSLVHLGPVNSGPSLLFSAILLAGVGAYVIWNSVHALARMSALRPVPARTRRAVSDRVLSAQFRVPLHRRAS